MKTIMDILNEGIYEDMFWKGSEKGYDGVSYNMGMCDNYQIYRDSVKDRIENC